MNRLIALLTALLLLSSCDLRERSGPTKPLAVPTPFEDDPPPGDPGGGGEEGAAEPGQAWTMRLVEHTDYARHKKYAQVMIDGPPKCKQLLRVAVRWQSVVGQVTRMNVSVPYQDQGSIWGPTANLGLPFVSPDTAGYLLVSMGAGTDTHPTGNGAWANTQWKSQPDSLWPGGIVKLWLEEHYFEGWGGGPTPVFYTHVGEMPVVLSPDTLVFHVQPDGTF
jgi:hypothetical protein